MTKKLGIAFINLYQVFLSPVLKILLGTGRFCRFEETCSEYTKRKIKERGLLGGLVYGAVRVSKCQPFYNIKVAK